MNVMSVKNGSFSYENYQKFLDKWASHGQKVNSDTKSNFNNLEMHNYLKIIRQTLTIYN